MSKNTIERIVERTVNLSSYLRRLPHWANSSYSFHGKPKNIAWHLDDYGLLPAQYHASVDKAGYVVYSYTTPIAWRNDEGWIFPQVKYSNQTTKQQKRTLEALRIITSETVHQPETPEVTYKVPLHLI